MRRPRLPRLPRRPVLPDEVRALRLPRGEHVHAAAAVDGGGHLVVTGAGLRLVDAGGEPWELLPWVDVDRATWEPPHLHVEPAPTADGVVRPAWDVALPEPGTVPRQLRARVDATIAWSVRHTLSGPARGDVRLVARRPADGGPLRWRVWPDPGVRLHDPLVRAEIEELLRAAQVTVGGGRDDPLDPLRS